MVHSGVFRAKPAHTPLASGESAGIEPGTTAVASDEAAVSRHGKCARFPRHRGEFKWEKSIRTTRSESSRDSHRLLDHHRAAERRVFTAARDCGRGSYRWERLVPRFRHSSSDALEQNRLRRPRSRRAHDYDYDHEEMTKRSAWARECGGNP